MRMHGRLNNLRTPAAIVQYRSLIVPFRGPVKRNTIIAAIRDIQYKWRGQCRRLTAQGCEAFRNGKIGFAYNCPPVLVHITPAIKPCGLRICPFDYARRTTGIFMRMRELFEEHPYAKLVVYRMVAKNDELKSCTLDDFTDIFNTAVYPKHMNLAKHLRKKRLSTAYGGYHHIAFAPPGGKKIASDELPDRWHIFHGCVALVPPEWQLNDMPHTNVVYNLNEFKLAYYIGKTFRYHPQWLSANPKSIIALLRALHNKRLYIGFGAFAGAKNEFPRNFRNNS